jgi:hypothetical protein
MGATRRLAAADKERTGDEQGAQDDQNPAQGVGDEGDGECWEGHAGLWTPCSKKGAIDHRCAKGVDPAERGSEYGLGRLEPIIGLGLGGWVVEGWVRVVDGVGSPEACFMLREIVYIIDDDPLFCGLCAGYLGEREIVTRGFHALEAALDEELAQPAAIILDWRLGMVDSLLELPRIGDGIPQHR